MSKLKQTIDSLAAVGIAVAFQWFFMFTKHDPRLRPVIPFGDDPYDALGSFATIVNILLVLLLIWRTFRVYGRHRALDSHYLRRTQAAIVLCVLVSLAADSVAMARHPAMWVKTDSNTLLLAAFGSMAAVAGAALYSILRSSSEPPVNEVRGRARLAVAVAMFLAILAAYPERLIQEFYTHMGTILIGDVLLFATVAMLLSFLLPDARRPGSRARKTRRASLYIWTGAIVSALAIGAWLFVAEMGEGGGPTGPSSQRVFVASVYIGLTVIGTMIAHAFLKRPLGLGAGGLGRSDHSAEGPAVTVGP